MAYPKHAKTLARARADLKAGVKEEPLGSNTGRRVREMQAHTWLGGTRWPWCAAAVVTWAEEAGFTLPYQGAGAYAWLDWAKKAGWTCTPAQAIPGDFVVFNIGAGHIAMLELPVEGGNVQTIDGNSSDRVKRNVRGIASVRGIVHLPEKPTYLPPAKAPKFEVVTSENGHRVIYVSTASRVGKKLAQILGKHPSVTIRRRRKQ